MAKYFGNWLAERRGTQTASWMAAKLRVSQSMLSLVEGGKRNFGTETLSRLPDALGVTPEDLDAELVTDQVAKLLDGKSYEQTWEIAVKLLQTKRDQRTTWDLDDEALQLARSRMSVPDPDDLDASRAPVPPHHEDRIVQAIRRWCETEPVKDYEGFIGLFADFLASNPNRMGIVAAAVFSGRGMDGHAVTLLEKSISALARVYAEESIARRRGPPQEE